MSEGLLHVWEAELRDKWFNRASRELSVPLTAARGMATSAHPDSCTRAQCAGAGIQVRRQSGNAFERERYTRRGDLCRERRVAGARWARVCYGAICCTASMWSSSGTMPATPTRLARLEPAAYIMLTVYTRRVQLMAASGCCFETIGRTGAVLARRSSVLCADTLPVQWRAAIRARRAAVALACTGPRTARTAAAHMGSRVALCARDV